uniref:Secreted protein n=1 Tax=Rhizophora mucronata TaxID=61149 RepID=A0A2P2QUQ2_RHIMU
MAQMLISICLTFNLLAPIHLCTNHKSSSGFHPVVSFPCFLPVDCSIFMHNLAFMSFTRGFKNSRKMGLLANPPQIILLHHLPLI